MDSLQSKQNDDRKQLNIKIDDFTYKKIVALAKSTNRSVSGLIKFIVLQYLK